MIFLSPLALLGLVAALIPPLLHLFQRRRPPEVEFPAVRYLQQTEREAQRQVRLQHLLLMALRVLAVVMIVLAAARPVVPGGAVALHEPTAVALILDNSLSSGAMAGGQPVLEDLAARARETLRQAQAGDALWLIRADAIARRGTPGELIDAVTATRPDARRLDLAEAVRTGATLVRASGYARTEVHVLSDLQKSAVGNRQPATGDSALLNLPLLIYHPAASPPVNRGVARARPRPAVWLAGAGGGAVSVELAGGPLDAAAPNAALQLTINGRAGGRALGAPGSEAALDAPRVETGWRQGVVTVEADELRADDERPFGVRVVAPANVAPINEAELGSFLVQALAVLNDRQPAAGSRQPELVTIGVEPRGRRTIVFPPADGARVGATNRALAAAGIPWRYGASVTRDDSLVAPAVAELAGARVAVRHRLEPEGAGDSSEVLARAGRDPWLVRHGTVVIVGSRMVPEHTTLPVSGRFVPFLSALVNRLSRGESGVMDVLPGEPVALPASVASLAAADSSFSIERGAVIAAPVTPGVYAMLGGRDTLGLLVVGFDPRESDLTRAAAGDVSAAWPGARASVTDDAAQYGARRFRGAGQSELTGWLLVIALGILVVESLVAAGALRRRTGA